MTDDPIECLQQALTAAQAIEDGITNIYRTCKTAFADLRRFDAWLTDGGFPTKKPELIEGDGTDLGRCCDLARDISARIRLAVAMAAVAPAGSA
jgi:hypothetical protein